MPALPQLVPGRIFARDFRILHLLAEGGMGAVYVAEQLSTGKRRALKVMLPQLVQDERARERFAQEARIGAHIDSEHVVETVAAGIDEASGLPWLAMELLEGRDLAHTVRERGALPPAEVHEILQQLGDGLGAAHAKGIVHRDLKPENLFIAVSRRRGVPFTLKILDFGIAKLTQESRSTLSATAAVGSPIWMAPEQTDQQVRIRPATDVWALGLIAFHLLTGRYYWRVANHPDVRLTALFTEVLVTPLEPASVRGVQLGVGHLVPAGFDAWLARCLDRDPDRRFPDARVALASLSPGLSLRDEATLVPPTHEHPAARRGVAPTVPMPPSQGTLPAPHAYAPPSQPPAPWSAPYGALPPHGHASQGPQPSQVPYGSHGPHPSQAPYPSHGPHASHAPHPSHAPHATPYAVHASSTSTGPLGARSAGRGLVLVAGLAAALIGAGVTAFGGLVLWQRLSASDTATSPPPVASTVPARLDAGSASAPPVHADAGPAPAAPVATPPDAGSATPARVEPPAPARPRPPPTPSPAAFSWADGATQRWRGTWSLDEWRYAITLRLRRDGREVSGTIGWRLLATPSADFQPRVGDSADELVHGTYDEATGTLHLEGYQTSDRTLIAPDAYDLRVAAGGALAGRSASENGRVSARPAD